MFRFTSTNTPRSNSRSPTSHHYSRNVPLTCCAVWLAPWPGLTVSRGLWSIAPGHSVGLSTSPPSARRSASPPVYPKRHKSDTSSVCVWQGNTSTQRICMTPSNKSARIPIHTLPQSFSLFSHSNRAHRRSNTYSQCCLYKSIAVPGGVWQEGAVDNGLQLASACLTFCTHTVMKSCPMKYVQALSLSLCDSHSLSDVWRLKQPSLPAPVDSLLPSPSSPFLSSLPPPTAVLLLSLPHSLALSSFSLPPPTPSTYSLAHIFPPDDSLTLSPSGIQLSALTDVELVETHTNKRVTKTRPDTGNRLEKEENEKRRRGKKKKKIKTPPLFFNSPKLRKTGERHGWRSPEGKYRAERVGTALTIQRNCHTVNILWRLETEQQGRWGAQTSKKEPLQPRRTSQHTSVQPSRSIGRRNNEGMFGRER